MNSNIRYSLMQARIVGMHRQARRTTTGSTAHAAIPRLCQWVIGLVATAVAFLPARPPPWSSMSATR